MRFADLVPLIFAMPAAFLLTALVRRAAIRGAWLDVPNSRSSHSVPTPRGGGLAIVLTFAAALAWLLHAQLLSLAVGGAALFAGGLVALMGILDDRYSLPASVRLLAHASAAIAFVSISSSAVAAAMERSLGVHAQWMAIPVAVLGIIWCTNLYNFMDGIDGLAAAEGVFVAGAGACLSAAYHGDSGSTLAMLALAAAVAGFLPWNWPPANIFLGDVGSGFIGVMLALLALSISMHSGIPVQVWLILLGLFVVDATYTLIRRIARGERWASAHRTHAYQKLSRRWSSHLRVTALYSAVNVLWLLPIGIYAAAHPRRATLCAIVALAPLVALVWAAGAGVPDPPGSG